MLFNKTLHSDWFILWKIGGPVMLSPAFIPLSISEDLQQEKI
jgi:hypothetical protein